MTWRHCKHFMSSDLSDGSDWGGGGGGHCPCHKAEPLPMTRVWDPVILWLDWRPAVDVLLGLYILASWNCKKWVTWILVCCVLCLQIHLVSLLLLLQAGWTLLWQRMVQHLLSITPTSGKHYPMLLAGGCTACAWWPSQFSTSLYREEDASGAVVRSCTCSW